jgi:transcriptional regulator with XRE-family HTH domain
MSERDTFGPRLRRERERRAISLETIAARTNVSVELWMGLEQNDFSKWPRRIFARAFVRDYARVIGLDPDEVVEDFCRLYPIGDRRVLPTLRAQAELIGHESAAADDPSLIPGGVDRRAAPDPAQPKTVSKLMSRYHRQDAHEPKPPARLSLLLSLFSRR